jgi:hypothetical protein
MTLALAGAAGGTAAQTSAPFPERGTYHGGEYPAEDLVTRGLACNVQHGALSCFDSVEEADRAAAAETLVASLAGELIALASCSPPLRVWWDVWFQGSSIGFYDYPGWQDLPVSWRNQTSSWDVGCRAGRLSDYTGGGGNTIGLPEGSSAPAMPSGWDNRADAIYRY